MEVRWRDGAQDRGRNRVKGNALAAKKVNRRAERVGIYFWPSVELDRVVLDIVHSLKTHGRSADILRLALVRGLRDMTENGDMPPMLVERLDLRKRLAVRYHSKIEPSAFRPNYTSPVIDLPPEQPIESPAAAVRMSEPPKPQLQAVPDFLESLAGLMESQRTGR